MSAKKRESKQQKPQEMPIKSPYNPEDGPRIEEIKQNELLSNMILQKRTESMLKHN